MNHAFNTLVAASGSFSRFLSLLGSTCTSLYTILLGVRETSADGEDEELVGVVVVGGEELKDEEEDEKRRGAVVERGTT